MNNTQNHRAILKKGILLGTIVLLLIGAAWVNQALEERAASPSPMPVSAQSTGSPSPQATYSPATMQKDYFASFRAERAALRERTLSILDEVIDKNASEEAVNAASDAKVDLALAMEKEFALEGILKAKGYADAAVIIQEELVSVIVKKMDLDQADAARILQAAQDVTGREAKDIKIIPAP